MFIAALFTVAKKWKQPKFLLTDDWINKTWSVYTVEYYSFVKGNSHTMKTWMNLEDVMLSKISQVIKRYCIRIFWWSSG